MKKEGKKKLLYILLILAIIGMLTSLYLLKDHYSSADAGSVCDFSDTVSCSLANSSVFSEFLSVPVALLGAIWMLIFVLMLWNALQNEKFHLGSLVVWTGLGVLSVFYFVYAELALGVICPFCTLVHGIIVASFIICLYLFHREYHWNTKKVAKAFMPWLIWGAILTAIPLLLFNIYGTDDSDYSDFAQCITDEGINMYGSYKCSYCAQTRELFGEAFIYINEIECHPDGEHSQWELCQEKEIEGTPTWILEPNDEEVKRNTGFIDLEDLAEFSGCALPGEEEAA